MPINVVLFSKYTRMGASSRLRSMQYLLELERSGINVDVFPLFDDCYLQSLYAGTGRSKISVFKAYLKRFLHLFRIFNYDLIWIEKELFPYVPSFFEKFISILGVRYIVDFDDAIFHNYDLSSNKIVRFFLATKIDKVMRNSRFVIVGNEYLSSRARVSGACNIKLIPTVLDHSRYKVTVNTSGPLVLGWIGSPSTQKYISNLRSVFLSLQESTSFELHLIGATEEMITLLDGVDVTVIPWSENTEAQNIELFDVGLMPLADGPWERGKCGYKLLQYMASGKPVVASPVGVNVDIVSDNKCGFLANTDSEWLVALATLTHSPSLSRQYGLNGRIAVENSYSIEAQFHNIENVIRSAGKRIN